MMTLSDLSTILGTPPTPVSFALDRPITGVWTDNRQKRTGNVWIALKGDSFDGHDFIKDAVNQGVDAVVCSRPDPTVTVPQWIVPDPTEALIAMATVHRRQMVCPVIALTGSNGKTTVKEMIAAILPKPSHATRGNLNNHLGVPMSVLNLNSMHRSAVFELGANHPGEIARLVKIVAPQVTLINNIGPAHVAGFGSIEGVAAAKGEIHQGLSDTGTAIINDDDSFAKNWDSILMGKKVLRFSVEHSADVMARNVTFKSDGCAQFQMITPIGEASLALAVPGLHNVSNALAATAAVLALNIGVTLAEITAALTHFCGVHGRMTMHYCESNVLIIDDTYNANLRSTLMALDVLARRPGRRIFIFGDMGELGELSQSHHHAVGIAAKAHSIERVMACGPQSRYTIQSFGEAGVHYPDQDTLIQSVQAEWLPNTTILIKGSRSSGMERVVQQLLVSRT